MSYCGIVFHHSVCPSINGKGYDFFISRLGLIIPGTEATSPEFIHICLEGDFSVSFDDADGEMLNQLFVASKLIMKLKEVHGFSEDDLYPHELECPGSCFPWAELVISMQDGYH